MEISQLRYFCAIADTRHLREAAELLGISPGALSKSMSLLHEELGERLFVPSGRGIALTPAAHEFSQKARNVLLEFDQLKAMTSGRSTNTGPTSIRLVSMELFTTYFLAEVLDQFPNSPFHVMERVPGEIEKAVLTFEADFGLTYAPVPHPKLQFLKIGNFEKRVYARAGCFQDMALEDVPFAVPDVTVKPSPSGIRDIDGWPTKQERNVVYRFDLLETSLQVASQGKCAIFCPAFVIPLYNKRVKDVFRLAEIPVPKNIVLRRNAFIAKRKSDPETQIIRKFARCVRLLCK